MTSLDEVRPRLDRAEHWITTQVPAEQRTRVRDEPDTRAAGLARTTTERESLRLLLDGLDEHWSLDGLTTLVYGVPKIQAGLAPDAKPTPELKVAQRAFFALLYQLLVGRDTGPRLPTLLLAVGADRVRKLLGGLSRDGRRRRRAAAVAVARPRLRRLQVADEDLGADVHAEHVRLTCISVQGDWPRAVGFDGRLGLLHDWSMPTVVDARHGRPALAAGRERGRRAARRRVPATRWRSGRVEHRRRAGRPSGSSAAAGGSRLLVQRLRSAPLPGRAGLRRPYAPGRRPRPGRSSCADPVGPRRRGRGTVPGRLLGLARAPGRRLAAAPAAVLRRDWAAAARVDAATAPPAVVVLPWSGCWYAGSGRECGRSCGCCGCGGGCCCVGYGAGRLPSAGPSAPGCRIGRAVDARLRPAAAPRRPGSALPGVRRLSGASAPGPRRPTAARLRRGRRCGSMPAAARPAGAVSDERHAVAGEPQRHQGLHGGLAAPARP